ncbi:DEAD/DEAH box helicase family protein [Pseudofrankia sp. DC12]|uniref:DEAD/DEAH box helicase family protein n=1 Tax=Pseudofrankia sp. DC12 TaxID=683315 RepID=UPI0005F7EE98|nr:DEAD/DEAH box helicase family protein [Pseudofrankia sp. DC12]
MGADPRLRVLWIADQQELVEQAARTFVDLATTLPVTFERKLRRIHSMASASTTLVDADNDIVVVTRASVTGGKAAAAARKRLGRFLTGRPCVIVIDEAHHAVAPSYEALLDHVFTVADPVVVGLTATPWPARDGSTAMRCAVSSGSVSSPLRSSARR